MPITVKCQCGKSLKVKDQLAGKAVKCPGCSQVVKVPAAGAAPATPTPAPAAPVQPAPMQPASPAANQMADLFDEEGFGTQVAAACPACGSEMPAGAVLCTKCGYHTQAGEKLEGHRLAGVDIELGEVALMKAEEDMARDKQLQRDMESRAGLPWWGLALVLFVLSSAAGIAVVAINAANQTVESDFNAMKTFLVMSGIGCGVVAAGAVAKMLYHAIKKDATKGQMIKIGIVSVVMIGATVGCLVASTHH